MDKVYLQKVLCVPAPSSQWTHSPYVQLALLQVSIKNLFVQLPVAEGLGGQRGPRPWPEGCWQRLLAKV